LVKPAEEKLAPMKTAADATAKALEEAQQKLTQAEASLASHQGIPQGG
jgi:hypothetical protein